MYINNLIAEYPKLYHMAEDGSWPSIQKYGLLSTSSLLDMYKCTGTKRDKIECEWRSKKEPLNHPQYGEIVIRDQKVMPPKDLKLCLENGMIPSDWYKLINRKVFFWVKPERLKWFLSAHEYKNSPHIVIIVDTRILLNKYSDNITLTTLNTGSTLYSEPYTKPRNRGYQSFRRVTEFPLSEIRKIVELVVDDGIPDITAATIRVARYIARKLGSNEPVYEKLENIWQRLDS